jgi:hypothetical protein
MKTLTVAFLIFMINTNAQSNNLNLPENVTIAFGAGVQKFHTVFNRQLEQGFKAEDIADKVIVTNMKLGYDFGPIFVEGAANITVDLKADFFLCTGLNLKAGKYEFSPVVAANLHSWYYGGRVYLKPVYVQAERQKDHNGHCIYNLTIGLKGLLFE